MRGVEVDQVGAREAQRIYLTGSEIVSKSYGKMDVLPADPRSNVGHWIRPQLMLGNDPASSPTSGVT